MCRGVVSATQEHEVVETRIAAIGPVDDVVSIGPRGGCGAPFPCTATVALFQCSSNRRGDRASPAADVEYLGARAEDHRDDPSVAGKPTKRLRVDSDTIDLWQPLEFATQDPVVDRHRDVGLLASGGLDGVVVIEEELADVGESVGISLGC